jgi:prevent-host-death family protein
MILVGIAELKAQLSKYIRMAKRGDEIGVRDHSEVVARIVSAQQLLPLRARAPKHSLQSVVIPPLKGKRIDVVAMLREERGER